MPAAGDGLLMQQRGEKGNINEKYETCDQVAREGLRSSKASVSPETRPTAPAAALRTLPEDAPAMASPGWTSGDGRPELGGAVHCLEQGGVVTGALGQTDSIERV